MSAEREESLQFLYFLCGGSKEIMTEVKEWCRKNDAERSSIFQERIAKATELIEKGNECFKTGDTMEAKAHYLAASFHADFDASQQTELQLDHKVQIRNVMIRILLNVANAALKLREFNLAKLSCSIGLDLAKTDEHCSRDTIAKLLYRRARALMELKAYEESAVDAKKAMEILGSDPAVREVYLRASTEAKRAKLESENVWKGKHLFGEEPIETFPEVDLVLTDEDGNRIEDPLTDMGSFKQTSTLDTEESLLQVVLSLICCKRKPKLE